jgi:hypothetical protein
MIRNVVNAFLSSPLVTENNKSNLMGLVQKLSDRDLKAEYTKKILAKQPTQKDSMLE